MKCNPERALLAELGELSWAGWVGFWVHCRFCSDCRQVRLRQQESVALLRSHYGSASRASRPFLSHKAMAWTAASLVIAGLLVALSVTSFRESVSRRQDGRVRTATYEPAPQPQSKKDMD